MFFAASWLPFEASGGQVPWSSSPELQRLAHEVGRSLCLLTRDLNGYGLARADLSFPSANESAADLVRAPVVLLNGVLGRGGYQFAAAAAAMAGAEALKAATPLPAARWEAERCSGHVAASPS